MCHVRGASPTVHSVTELKVLYCRNNKSSFDGPLASVNLFSTLSDVKVFTMLSDLGLRYLANEAKANISE